MYLTGIVLALMLQSAALQAADPAADRAALKAKIMENTKVIGVMDVEGPSTSYADDADPNTLEIVFLSKKSDGPSRVSPNGEVVFLYKASEDQQSELIGQAFELRIERTLGGS